MHLYVNPGRDGYLNTRCGVRSTRNFNTLVPEFVTCPLCLTLIIEDELYKDSADYRGVR